MVGGVWHGLKQVGMVHRHVGSGDPGIGLALAKRSQAGAGSPGEGHDVASGAADVVEPAVATRDVFADAGLEQIVEAADAGGLPALTARIVGRM
jgi:hypothetical protein